MIHLSAFTVAIGTVANTDVPAVFDEIIALSNGHLLPPQDLGVVAAWVGSATINRARFNSPTLRQIFPPFIRPINFALLPTNDPNLATWAENPVRIRGQEELQLEASSDVAVSEQLTGFVWLQDQFTPAPIGDIYTIRAVSTTTTTARVWSPLTLTFDASLPAGTYAVIGGEYIATTGQAFRMIFDQQFFRPGGLGTAVIGNRTHEYFYGGKLGLWGRFRTFSLPRIEVFTDTAISVHTVYLQVVRVGA